MPSPRRTPAIIPCQLRSETQSAIRDYADALKIAAPTIGNHGLSEEEFWESGLFQGAIERLRGQRAASMVEKRAFISAVLDHLRSVNAIAEWRSSGGGDRHDYEVVMNDGTITVIEAKGCLDGNNTNIFERPPNADEFVIWSLCQNPGADPRHNAWSGIHTRLSAEIIHRGQRVDGLIIWDMVCGTIGRICPKLEVAPGRETRVGQYTLPPPCIYLFPRSIPDPRSNPTPRCWRLAEVKFLAVVHEVFQGLPEEVTEVYIEADMQGASVRRVTRLVRNAAEIICSAATPLQRANR